MKICLQPRPQRATTIMEVVVSLVIVTIAASGIIRCFGYGFFAMELARENQRATQVMLEKVETLRLYSWDQVNSNGFIPITFVDIYDPQAPFGSRGVTYNGTVTITNFPSSSVSYSNNLRQVTVSLTWLTTRGFPRTRSITTFVAKDGLQNYVY